MNIFQQVYEIVEMIPCGKVATYGQIATLLGNPRMSRVVGYALHVNPDPEKIPCYRVVNKQGEVSSAFAFGGPNRQRELLENEGIEFIGERVDMEKHIWRDVRIVEDYGGVHK